MGLDSYAVFPSLLCEDSFKRILCDYFGGVGRVVFTLSQVRKYNQLDTANH